MTKNKNSHFPGCLETCKKLGPHFGRVWWMCERINKPINRIISGKVLPVSLFPSTNCYRSEEPPKNQTVSESNCKL